MGKGAGAMLFLFLSVRAVLASSSKLSVALCNSGNLPYISIVNRNASGFDLGEETPCS